MIDRAGTLIQRAMARAGDRVALRTPTAVRSHAEVLERSARFANALAGHGLVPGDRVAIMVADQFESVESYLGCMLGGFTIVHVNDRLATPELDGVVGDAEPRAFVYTDSVAPVVAPSAAVAETGVVVGIGELANGAHHEWNSFLDAASTDVPSCDRGPNDVAIIGYTSGTTGKPKGVVHTEYSLLRILYHMPLQFGLSPYSRCAFTGTFSFVPAIWGVVLPHLYLGGEVSFMGGFEVDRWFDSMVAERSQVTYVPTPLARTFVAEVERRPEVLVNMTSALHSGSKLPADQVRALIDAIGSRFVECYGMTETGSPVTRTTSDDWTSAAADDIYASAGRANNLAEISIVGRDGSTLAQGEVGEISVAIETMFAGYFRQPELTAEVLRDGHLLTGDVGYLDAAGYLYVTDRAKDMIVSGGMNVFPAEVEAALDDIPGLRELAIIGVPHERWGETVVAVAAVDDPTIDEQRIIEIARERLASYKKPTAVRFVDALPRTASLKIDKPALRERWATLVAETGEQS